MATRSDVRRIALALPGVVEASDTFAFSVLHKGKAKGIAWVWQERVHPKEPRVPNPGVLAVRVASLAVKDLILQREPAKYFTEPHYNGFPAVLVRLKAVKVADLRPLLEDAWRAMAPAALDKKVDTTLDTRRRRQSNQGTSPDSARSRTEAPMKKKGARDIPDFSHAHTAAHAPIRAPSAQDPAARKTAPAPSTRQASVKPAATTTKMGRRGQ